VTGKQEYATSLFDHQESVLNAGVLFCIPALISQGLEKLFTILKPLPAGVLQMVTGTDPFVCPHCKKGRMQALGLWMNKHVEPG
jgi:hypothetical protein